MTEKILVSCIALILIAIACLIFVVAIEVISFIEIEFREDIADWIREKVFAKKRGAK